MNMDINLDNIELRAELDILNQKFHFGYIKYGEYERQRIRILEKYGVDVYRDERRSYKMSEEQQIVDDFTDEDKVSGDIEFWKHKEQKEVIGLFKRWEKDSFGEHAILQTNDKIELHLPNLTALNGKLKSRDVKEGNKVKAIYLGEKKSEKSGRMYDDFEVFVK